MIPSEGCGGNVRDRRTGHEGMSRRREGGEMETLRETTALLVNISSSLLRRRDKSRRRTDSVGETEDGDEAAHDKEDAGLDLTESIFTSPECEGLWSERPGWDLPKISGERRHSPPVFILK